MLNQRSPYTSQVRRICVALFSILLLGASLVPLPPRTSAADRYSTAWHFAAAQLLGTTQTIATTAYPSATGSSGSWNTTGANGWTSGFFPGSLWLMAERTHDPAWQAKAQSWQAGLRGEADDTDTHDVGFKILTSFGNGHRLTGDDASRQVVLTGAAALAARYSPVVGATRSWGQAGDAPFTVIIDNMMNIEILFWGASHGGPSTWRDMAISHALKTRENHVRADGSTYQVVDYDPNTGAVLRKRTHQGYNTESTWSRGQAWAIYGFTMSYRETNDGRFLDTARRTADYFLEHLPSDHVPYWDLELPTLDGQPRDSSAGAIAAAGLLELARLEPDLARQQTYRTGAVALLDALSSPAYLAQGTSNQSILLHGTQNKPDGKFDTGLIYGDYYFLQALLRYAQLVPDETPTPTDLPTPSATPTTPPSGGATTYLPIVDAYVRDGSAAATNFGAASTLEIKTASAGYNRQSFVRFDMTNRGTAVISQALLTLVITNLPNGTPAPLAVFAVEDDSWGEQSLTWNNRPALGPQLASLSITATGRLTVDLTTFVNSQLAGDRIVSLALIDPTQAAKMVAIGSRESTGNQPALVLSGQTATPTPTAIPTGTPSTQFTFGAAADTYVSQSSPTSSYGSSSQLQAVGGSSAKQAFLRFAVAGLPAGAFVRSAKLRLVVVNDSTSGGIVSSISDTSWTETLTWNTRPAIDGPQRGTVGAVAQNHIVEVDVTAAITGNGSYSFAITLPSSNTNTVGYASRHATTVGNRPQLVIVNQ